MECVEFDQVVLGGGSAGYAAARVLADGGQRVAVVDGSAELGGLCILRGCMPTKALLQSAEVAHAVQSSALFGIQTTFNGVDFDQVMRRKGWLIDDFAGYRREQLTSGERFQLFRSPGRFVDAHTVELDSGQRLSAQGFVIATGSKISDAPLASLATVGYLDSDDVLRLERLPESILVLGGGVIAVEFAQFFVRMGVRVTLIQRSAQLLKEVDEDAAQVLAQVLEREGVRVFLGTNLEEFSVSENGKRVRFSHQGRSQEVEAQEIFFAMGRTPNTEGLNLEAAGVETERYGRIRIDGCARTSQPHIYAAGDCASPYEVVHLAIHQAEVAAHHLLDADCREEIDYRLRMSVVFTEPQVAMVGITEKEARAQNLDFVTASYPFDDHGKSMIMNANDGFVKIIADAADGAILGASCVGPHGGELLHEVVVAMAARMTVQAFSRVPHYHPTLAEIWTYPAEELSEVVASRVSR